MSKKKEFKKKYTMRYGKLLAKYCADKDIFDLIEQCIISDFGEREETYEKFGRYPEQRDRLMKLKNDLIEIKRQIIEANGGGK